MAKLAPFLCYEAHSGNFYMTTFRSVLAVLPCNGPQFTVSCSSKYLFCF